MATDLSQQILKQLQMLSPSEQQELLAELQRNVQRATSATIGRSVLELEGLGSEIWAGIDAQEYVRRERGSWNG